MKRTLILIALVIGCLATATAQKSNKKSKAVPEEVRVQSVAFANALRDYYSENYNGAETKLRNIVTSNGQNAAAYYLLGQVKRQQNNYVESEFYIRQAIERDKKNIWYMVDLAEVLDIQGKYEQSEKCWAAICKIEPRNENYLLAYAEACVSQEKIDQTIQIFNKIETLVGTTPEITDAKVEMHLYQNDVKGAIGEYERLIKENPNNAEYYTKAATICISNNLPDKALPYLTKAAELEPNNSTVLLQLGNFYDSKGDKKAAYESWLAAMRSSELDVEQKLAILRKYMAGLKNGEPTQEQITLAETLAEANPEIVEGWAAVGSIALKQKDYAKAAQNFEKALAIDESQFAIWQDYVYSLARSGNYARIISLKEQLIELFPTNSMIYYSIGNAYANTSRPSEAVIYLEKALKYTYDKTETALIHGTLSEVYDAIGDTEKAEMHRQKAH